MFNKIIILILLSASIYSQQIKVIKSTADYIQLSIKYNNSFFFRDTTINSAVFSYIPQDKPSLRMPGEPWLPSASFTVGLPSELSPEIQIISDKTETFPSKLILPFPDLDVNSGKDIFTIDRNIYGTNKYFPEAVVKNSGTFRMRYASIASIEINPLQFDPVQRSIIFHKEIIVNIKYKRGSAAFSAVRDRLTDSYLKNNVINYDQARNWQSKIGSTKVSKTLSTSFWYNPQKAYWKLFLNKKGLYRVTFDQLEAAGLVVSGKLANSKIELFNNGVHVPIHIVDGGDDSFNKGDYIQFIGEPPVNSPNSTLNLYNNQNIYWLSVQADSSGSFYETKNGFPDTWQKTFAASYSTIHYEIDSLYERLGLAENDQRDYWYWGKASGQNKQMLEVFSKPFPQPPGISSDSSKFRLRVNLHGMTSNSSINPDHNAEILLTSQPIGNIRWDGQTSATFDTIFDIREKAIFAQNNIQVVVKSDIPTPDPTTQTSDEVRVNWFELEYWREHRVNGNYFNFTSPPNITGKNRFSVFAWTGSTMNVYVPGKNVVYTNIQNTANEYKEWLFVDSVTSGTEYFCASEDYFMSPDSIVRNQNSDLRNTANAADYIIIAHPDFREAAVRLHEYRSSKLDGFLNPRVKTVFIQEIYNEFSNGLIDPEAVRNFIKFTMDNWNQPAPAYVVLLGDMSWDYRGKVKGSRKNFIPSIPYHSIRYGQAVSDNMFVCVSGDDVIPDLAIGRLSCETTAEASVLIDKIINYKSAQSKNWKENVLLIGAGESTSDENFFGFNDESVRLEKGYIIPSGYATTKVFRYPNRPEYQKFLGERPQIREAFNEGCVLANFYGHGGGYQWDFVFLNDDIYLLRNEDRLPVILSITCYTAHFDNQDVFGEQFNKVPGKGSIGFWGHTGITFWVYGVDLNTKLFNQIFTNKKYVIGDAIMFAKAQYQNAMYLTKDHIALLSFLGDPALELELPQEPDFRVVSSDISISPDYPLIDDTVTVKVVIDNPGRIFPGDSVSVELFAEIQDSSYSVGLIKKESFGNIDSVFFRWIPPQAGNYTLKAVVNEKDVIPEKDHSDNSASNTFVVYNLSEPYVIKPYNGYTAATDKDLDFIIADIGYYISKNLIYYIEIDTTTEFEKPLVISPGINPANGIGKWKINLPEGKYFWRTRLFDDVQYSRWSSIRTFSVSEDKREGYYAAYDQLKVFTLNNVLYSRDAGGLILNTALLPPKPNSDRFIMDIDSDFPEDVKGLSTITTDGTFIYLAHMAYYGGPSYIYRMGTGYNGTLPGEMYDPLANLTFSIWHQMFYHSDGHIYIPTGDAHKLHRINTTTSDTSSVSVPAGMLNSSNGKVQNGAFYLCSDGKYVYNLSYMDSAGIYRYKIRVFDPAQDWKLIEEINPSGSSYLGFTGFFVADNNCYPYENNISGFMRRIDLQSKDFKEEWLTSTKYRGFYAWTYDWVHDVIYASVYRNGFEDKIAKFAGKYKQAEGSVVTQEVGPAAKWNNIKYDLNTTGSTGFFSNVLEGYNNNKKAWDTLALNIGYNHSLSNINPDQYSKIRMIFHMADSSFGASEPIKMRSYHLNYNEPADLSVVNEDLVYSPDSLLQGFPLTLNIRIRNNGYSTSNESELNIFIDNNPNPVFKETFSVPADSFKDAKYEFNTNELFFSHKMKLTLKPGSSEMYSFNNYAEKTFYISRDSINPVFKITFDGIEILSGDVVSSNPRIVMTLSDNSPLSLADTSRFYIFYNNRQLSFDSDSLSLSSTPFPNSQAIIGWNPKLNNGRHTMEILARDASGNYFDTTSYSLSFEVNDENTLYNVYNYPNPFKDETFFTFTLTGNDLPREFIIKVFTVAGRMIREIKVPVSELRFGFNKVYWDGRDQDGNALANGVYFSKFVVRHKNNMTSIIQKLAKVK